jgi:hypothetical protein
MVPPTNTPVSTDDMGDSHLGSSAKANATHKNTDTTVSIHETVGIPYRSVVRSFRDLGVLRVKVQRMVHSHQAVQRTKTSIMPESSHIIQRPTPGTYDVATMAPVDPMDGSQVAAGG